MFSADKAFLEITGCSASLMILRPWGPMGGKSDFIQTYGSDTYMYDRQGQRGKGWKLDFRE